MKTFFLIASMIISTVTYAKSQAYLLEKQRYNGMENRIQDVMLYADGKVTESHATVSGLSAPQVIANISPEELSLIEASVNSIHASPQIELNRNYNPGGFESVYLLTNSSKQVITFAKNVSGADFGLRNNEGRNLVKLLDEFKTP